MGPGTRRRHRTQRLTEAAECFYVVLLLAALTQGSVLSIWIRSVQDGQVPTDNAILATYLAVQVPGIALLTRRGLARSIDSRFVTILVGLLAWLAASTMWSSLRADTMIAATSLVMTSGIGLYLASFSTSKLLALTFIAMQPGLFASVWAIWRDWPQVVYESDPTWIGIYFNRNSLGPPAVIGAATGAFVLARLLHDRHRRWQSWALVVSLLIAFDLRVQFGARSITSWAVLIVIGGTWVAAAALRSGMARRRRRAPRGEVLAGALAVALAIAWVFSVIARDAISRAVGRPAGFNDRTLYWSASWDGVLVHPLRGWGWLATWRTPAFRATLPPAATDVWSHSGYLDMALGGGVFAVILFAAVLVTAVRNAGSLLDEDDNAATAWPLAIVLAVALAATQESFFIGNHFYWALFVAAGATASRLPSRRAIERAHAPEPTPPPAGASSLP